MSSTIIRTVSFRVISLIAIVPLNECYTPILIVSSALAGDVAIAANNAVAIAKFLNSLFGFFSSLRARSAPLRMPLMTRSVKSGPHVASANLIVGAPNCGDGRQSCPIVCL